MIISDLSCLEDISQSQVPMMPEQAGIIKGGVTFCPYTTQNVTSRLRIRSGPSTSNKIVGYWYPGDVKYLESGVGVSKNGFRPLDSSRDSWVSTEYIRRTKGRCELG